MSTTLSNYEVARTVVDGMATFARGNGEMVDSLIKAEEILAKAGLNLNALNDSTLIPRLIGESRPDLIGRYLVALMKTSQLNLKMLNVAKLTLEEKKQVSKQFYAISEELKSVSLEIGK
ncbi:MAG: hypothetical protein WB661_01230 [Candidatus Bathyarchaeia archaeon]